MINNKTLKFSISQKNIFFNRLFKKIIIGIFLNNANKIGKDIYKQKKLLCEN